MTTFKLQSLLFGSKVNQASTESSPIEIKESPKEAVFRPFKSHPAERASFCPRIPSFDTDKRESELRKYSLEEVLTHDSPSDCWTIIYDCVYDLSNFLQEHPGGDDVILEYAGRDATLAFRSVGHSKLAEATLKPYLIGILDEKERLWSHFWAGMRRGSR